MEQGIGLYLFGLALATGLGLPLAVVGAGIGQGKAAAGAMEGMARQPELAGRIQTAMIIALAFIESLVLYALVMFFLLQGRLPAVADLVTQFKG
ncbi:MAG: ATP synthase F0 subunit C [Armatimonadetes bacterium]|nr:ATP synthase F0 subunit C [Armatimonadota bacterium]